MSVAARFVYRVGVEISLGGLNILERFQDGFERHLVAVRVLADMEGSHCTNSFFLECGKLFHHPYAVLGILPVQALVLHFECKQSVPLQEFLRHGVVVAEIHRRSLTMAVDVWETHVVGIGVARSPHDFCLPRLMDLDDLRCFQVEALVERENVSLRDLTSFPAVVWQEVLQPHDWRRSHRRRRPLQPIRFGS